MEVDDDVMFGSLLNNALVEVGHPLVGMIHEVDFHSCDSPLLIDAEDGVDVLPDGEPWQPENDFHTFGVAILNKVGQAQVVVADKWVAGRLCPTLVEQDVAQTILRGKSGEVAVGFVVATVAEIDVRSEGCCTVPPLPRHLSGMNPAGVLQRVATGELHGDGLLDDATAIGHGHPAPRQ